ncbi:MAG: ABC transporter ATP-binding protein [Rhodobacteraceae bacterium]|jgi:branched-chain amino acid transport system ATP-binding protein|nr:ABC transporter ATP-binding protein [Paracoccaceae bacterium]
MTTPLLEVEGLQAWYGEGKALHGVSLDVKAGEVVTLLGRNGAGKTTILRSVMGLVRRKTGRIRLNGADILGLPPEAVARRGIAYVPEERGIFASLTVEENMLLPPVLAPGGMSLEEVLTLFPNIRERWGSTGAKLSGGEQQMLAIGRILRTGSRLLLLDEPTEGLAPVIVRQIGAVIATLKARGYTVLLVEQNFRFAARLADRHYVVEHGTVIDRIDAADVPARGARILSYLKA